MKKKTKEIVKSKWIMTETEAEIVYALVSGIKRGQLEDAIINQFGKKNANHSMDILDEMEDILSANFSGWYQESDNF